MTSSIPPPLRALGGWPNADWFDPSILSEGAVVGITLPKLPGSRKQVFDLVERSAGDRRGSRPGIGRVLDGLAPKSEVSFRRPSFFFEAAPVLWFAELPATKLKVRASDALRRDLVAAAARGCVLRHEARRVVVMVWAAADGEITAFVRAAAPPYPLHPHFDEADAQRVAEPPRRGFLGTRRPADEPAVPPGKAGARPGKAAQERERRAHQAERDRLLAELDTLRGRVAELQRSQSAIDAMATLGLDDARLRAMLRLLHPDRHGNSEAANDATKWVNGLRDLLKATASST